MCFSAKNMNKPPSAKPNRSQAGKVKVWEGWGVTRGGTLSLVQPILCFNSRGFRHCQKSSFHQNKISFQNQAPFSNSRLLLLFYITNSLDISSSKWVLAEALWLPSSSAKPSWHLLACRAHPSTLWSGTGLALPSPWEAICIHKKTFPANWFFRSMKDTTAFTEDFHYVFGQRLRIESKYFVAAYNRDLRATQQLLDSPAIFCLWLLLGIAVHFAQVFSHTKPGLPKEGKESAKKLYVSVFLTKTSLQVFQPLKSFY